MFHRHLWISGIVLSGLVAAALGGANDGRGSGDTAIKRGASRGVQLLPSTPELSPNTTYELRFDEPIVKPEEIGLPAKVSPLVIKPAIPGQFVWLSRRTGLYTPTAPPSLATEYEFTLRPGLADADGRPVKARLAHRLASPAFGVTGHVPRGLYNTNLPVEPRLAVQFNANVNPALACRYLQFRGPAGLRIPAEVQTPTRDGGYYDGFYLGGDESPAWNDAFVSPESRPGARVPPYLRMVQREESTNGVTNRLLVNPTKPLTPGAGWKLVLDKGLPDATGKLRMPAAIEIPLGEIQPFVVASVEADNIINHGREIRLMLNKALATNQTDEILKNYISLTPAPDSLSLTLAENLVVIRGNFELYNHYILTVEPGLAAQERILLSKPFRKEVSFEPLKPRLYFPAFSDDQLAAGRRQIEMLSVNLGHVELRAKRFDEQTVIHALRGYRSYFKQRTWQEYNANDQEWLQRLDYNLVPGQTIYQTNLNIKSATDKVHRHPWLWDDLLGNRRHGVVFLQAEGLKYRDNQRPEAGAQAIVQVTDLGMIWKKSGVKTWVMVFSYATGQPVAGARVKMLSDENVRLDEQATDAEGVALLAGGEPSAAWLMAVKGEDLHALALRDEYQYNIPLYRFSIPFHWRGEADEPLQAALFSDRTVYRPGEAVHFKSIARQWDGQVWQMPSNRQAQLILTDSRQRTLLATNLNLSAFGSLDFTFALPAAPLGAYQARLDLPPTNAAVSAHHQFYVQEIQPNAFEVSLAAKPASALEDRLEFSLSARYYFGKPLTRAKVRWSLTPEYFYFAPDGFADFSFGSTPEKEDSSLLPVTGEAEINGQNALVIAPPLTNAAPTRPLAYNFLAEVTDLNQQTISADAGLVRHSADFYLGLKHIKEVLNSGEAVPVEVVAVNQNGSPRPIPVPFHAQLVKVTWQTVVKEGAGKTLVYENQQRQDVLKELDGQTLPAHNIGIKWETDPPATPLSFAVEEPGQYYIAVSAKDNTGRTTATEDWFNVSGPAKLGWNYRNPVQIELVPDHTSYVPGDAATVLVKTPISGSAVVTVERESLLRSYLVELQGNAPVIRVPIEPGDFPNVFVSVMMLRGLEKSPKQVKMPEMRIGYCQLNVQRPESKLTAVITTSGVSPSGGLGFGVPPSGGLATPASAKADAAGKDSVSPKGGTPNNEAPGPPKGGIPNAYEPRQQVEVVAEIRDGLNHPVPDTEVTLYAVDEGILSLTAYEAPDLYTLFYRPRSLAVATHFSLPGLLPEDPELASFHNKGYIIGGGGVAGDELRKNFLACAFWSARLLTGADGTVRISFTAPDSLTRYRIIALAHNARQQFGGGTGAFEIKKPLMLVPALPLFANVGDRLQARAVAHNFTDADGTIEVTLQTDTNAVAEKTNASVVVKARESAAVEFPVAMKAAGKSQWLWRARFHAGRPFTDTVQSTLTVGYAQPLLREILARRVAQGETNLLAGADPRLLEGEGVITVRLAVTRLAEVDEAASQLLHYPYGCVEQTSSSLLPWVVLSQHPAGRAILDRSQLNRSEAIARGLSRLLSMQTYSGGLSYWPGNTQPMLWASAYGGLVLTLMDRAGYEIPPERLKQLGDYLSTEVRGAADLRQQEQLSDRCLALLTLAMLRRPEPAYHEALFARRASLSTEDRAILALAILEANGAKVMARELLSEKSTLADREAAWFGCNARLRALQVLAWCRCQPDNPKLEELLDTLIADQTEGHWLTTQGNAWSLWALADHARLVEGGFKPARAILRYDGQDHSVALGGELSLFETNFPISRFTNLVPSLTLVNPAAGPLRARVILESRPRKAPVASEDHGFILRRAYHLLDDHNQPHDLKNPQPGDRVLVTLQLKLDRPAHYVAIDDPLPALFEPINSQFVTQRTTLAETDDYWYWDYREVRRDRVLYFRDHLPPGNYTIQHLARVRALGETTAPSAKVEEMYQPKRWGLSGSEAIVTTAGPAWISAGQ